MVATYSGSADGVYLPSRAVAPLYIYETCDKYGKANLFGDKYEGGSYNYNNGGGNGYGGGGGGSGGVLGAVIEGLTAEGGSKLPVYGNGYGGKYPDGHYYPPGARSCLSFRSLVRPTCRQPCMLVACYALKATLPIQHNC